MNAQEYKIVTSDQCSFRKEVLEDSLKLLKATNAKEASIIESALEVGGICKPVDHNDPDGHDFFWVRCTAEEANSIASYLFDAEAAAVPSSGATTPEASKYAALVDTWSDFRDWLEEGGSVDPHWKFE